MSEPTPSDKSESQSVDERMERHLQEISKSLTLIASTLLIALILSVLGGIAYGVAEHKQQQRLEKILNGETEDCSDEFGSSLPSCP